MTIAGFVVGGLLICIGLVIPILYHPSDLQIDTGPTPAQNASRGLMFTGLNVIIVSAIFFFRDIIRTEKKRKKRVTHKHLNHE